MGLKGDTVPAVAVVRLEIVKLAAAVAVVCEKNRLLG